METLDLCAGWGVVVALDYEGVSRSTLPLTVLSSLELCLRPFSFKLPQGLTEVHTQQLSPLALDPPFLSASRFAVSISHLSHTTGQSKERRGVDGGGGCFCSTLQNK